MDSISPVTVLTTEPMCGPPLGENAFVGPSSGKPCPQYEKRLLSYGSLIVAWLLRSKVTMSECDPIVIGFENLRSEGPMEAMVPVCVTNAAVMLMNTLPIPPTPNLPSNDVPPAITNDAHPGDT